MLINENFSAFEISSTDSARFRRIVVDVLTEACQMPTDTESSDYDGIGTLGEKQMHAAIKRYLCPDTSKHEILIDGSIGCVVKEVPGGEKKAAKKRRFVADILDGNVIYEIQTGPFGPLKEKIAWILENTTYNIMVIHPIAEIKWLNLLDAQTGEVKTRKKSPQRGKLTDIASELYYFRDFIKSPRFSLVILMMEAEQYKKNAQKDGRKRPRYRKYELIPVSLLRAHIFRSAEDYRVFIPEDLPRPFTVKQYSSLARIYGMDAYSIVHTLCHIGLLEELPKEGRAQLFREKGETPKLP